MKLTDFFENDDSHAAALSKTGFWGAQGAGCLVFAKSTKKFLIAYRSEYVQEGHTWGTWGGAIDAKEDPKDAVIRELHEETGFNGSVLGIVPLFVFRKDSFRYSNFVVIVEDEYEPHLNWENDRSEWCELGKFPNPKHFGLVSLLKDKESVRVMESLVGERDDLDGKAAV